MFARDDADVHNGPALPHASPTGYSAVQLLRSTHTAASGHACARGLLVRAWRDCVRNARLHVDTTLDTIASRLVSASLQPALRRRQARIRYSERAHAHSQLGFQRAELLQLLVQLDALVDVRMRLVNRDLDRRAQALQQASSNEAGNRGNLTLAVRFISCI